MATTDTWLSNLSILGAIAYTTGLTYSSQNGLSLDVTEAGESNSTSSAQSTSTYDLSTVTSHVDQTITSELYHDQSTLAFAADESYLYALQSQLAVSSDDEATSSARLVESGDGTTSVTSIYGGSIESSTIHSATTGNESPIVLRTSNDHWTDQLAFSNLVEFNQTTIFNEDDSFVINYDQSGSGASAFNHTGSGSSDEADETTTVESHQQHVWENVDYGYAFSTIIASFLDDAEDSTPDSNDPQGIEDNPETGANTRISPIAQVTDFDYMLTTHTSGGADLNGTSEFATSLISTLPITQPVSNDSALSNMSWDNSSNEQYGFTSSTRGITGGTEGGIGSVFFHPGEPESTETDSDDTDDDASETPWSTVFWEEGKVAINVPWRWIGAPAYYRANQTLETFQNDGVFAGLKDMNSAMFVDFNPLVQMYRAPFDAINSGKEEFQRTGKLSGAWWGFHKGLPGGDAAHGFYDAVLEQKVHVGPDAGRELTRNEIVRNILTPSCDAAAALALWGIARSANTPKNSPAPKLGVAGEYVPNPIMEHIGRGYGKALESGSRGAVSEGVIVEAQQLAENGLASAVNAAENAPTAAEAQAEILTRYANGKESVTRLNRLAQESLENPLERVYGLSVSAGPPTRPGSSLPRSAVEEHFPVHDTPMPEDPLHRTVEMPNPIPKEIADLWNKLWGFK